MSFTAPVFRVNELKVYLALSAGAVTFAEIRFKTGLGEFDTLLALLTLMASNQVCRWGGRVYLRLCSPSCNHPYL